MKSINENNLSTGPLKKARYVLLSGKTSTSSPYFSLYKNTYMLWKKSWEKAFGEVGSIDTFSPDEFYRQDFIPVIALGDEPVAAHFYSLFDIENPAALDHHYFEIFPDEALSILKSRGAKKLMSMEYLTVNPTYRKSCVGFSLAEVLVSLGSKLMMEIGVDASLGVALKAARVDKMGLKMNYEIICDEVSRGNLVCNIMAGFWNTENLGVLPEPEVKLLVDKLWQHRELDSSIHINFKNVA